MKRILVPFDFSPMAMRALRLASSGFPIGDADRVIDVVYVNEDEATEAECAARLAEDIAKVGGHSTIEQRVLRGSPWRKLVEYAESTVPDVIVLGARSHGTASDLFVGRTAFRVLRHTRASVLMLKNDDVATPPRNVLCLVDLAPGSESMELIREAFRLSQRCDAKLSVVHLIEQGVAPAILRSEVKHLWAKIADDARVELETLVARTGVQANIEVVRGHVREQMSRLVERLNADLVVIGSHHSNALERFFLGSFAEIAVQITACDVLVLR